jgi:hypothetical protein
MSVLSKFDFSGAPRRRKRSRRRRQPICHSSLLTLKSMKSLRLADQRRLADLAASIAAGRPPSGRRTIDDGR